MLREPYFENVPQVGDLNVAFIFLEANYLVFFLCEDQNGNLYICDCNDVYREQRWLIAATSLEQVNAMLNNKIPMREIFSLSNGPCFVAIWKTGWKHPRYQTLNSGDEFEDADLPTANEYYDADEDELEEFAQYVAERQEQCLC